MKKTLFIAAMLLTAAAQSLLAREGYRVKLTAPDAKDTMVYLVHYYGNVKPMYISDSTRFDRSGVAILESKDPDFKGGIYTIMFKDSKQTNFELLLNKGDDIAIFCKRSAIPKGIEFRNSPENDRFRKYHDFIESYAIEQKALEAELKEAKTAADTAAVRKKAIASNKERINYMRNYAASYPGTLLATVFNAMEVPEIPEGTHYLDDGRTKDSTFAYRYYKTHYWDKFNFKDDRLIYTPIYDGKIEEYISKLVLASPDSVNKESDMLLEKAKGTKDMFHYTLFWLTHYAENSKVMGLDEVFVHLVENYYMKGDAFWLTTTELAKYIDRAKAIAPNVIGNLAPEVKQPNVFTKKEESLHALKTPYTLLVFYSPTCGHCEHELPLLDSLYEATLKDKGLKVFTVATEGEEKQITDFLTKHKLDKKWTNTWDPEGKRDFRDKYDVFSTPTIYLLDEKKIIRGKRIDHNNIGTLVEMLEKKNALGKQEKI
jgi:thiol-disulfide isomerase/thioredoxin